MNKSIAKEYNFRWEKKRRTQRLETKMWIGNLSATYGEKCGWCSFVGLF